MWKICRQLFITGNDQTTRPLTIVGLILNRLVTPFYHFEIPLLPCRYLLGNLWLSRPLFLDSEFSCPTQHIVHVVHVSQWCIKCPPPLYIVGPVIPQSDHFYKFAMIKWDIAVFCSLSFEIVLWLFEKNVIAGKAVFFRRNPDRETTLSN